MVIRINLDTETNATWITNFACVSVYENGECVRWLAAVRGYSDEPMARVLARCLRQARLERADNKRTGFYLDSNR